ncbi:MAG: ferritin-like domain-containing protein [Planctomycetota bacterium]
MEANLVSGLSKEEKLNYLNKYINDEIKIIVKYLIESYLVSGPGHEDIKARLQELVDDSIVHLKKYIERIVAMGAVPKVKDIEISESIEKILEDNIMLEFKGYKEMIDFLKKLNKFDDIKLYETVEDIAQEEQEHYEELKRLKGEWVDKKYNT